MARKKSDLPEPVKAVRLDAKLKRWGNGRLPETALSSLKGGGRLYTPAAKQYNAMYEAAQKDGVVLSPVATGYRSFAAQEALFFQRYSPKPTLRRPRVTRLYQGKKWYLKRGMSPSATPGTSPHGWGLAQDINVQDPKVFRWLCHNAPRFGFYLQGKQTLPNGKPNPEYEAWHWQYCDLD